MSGRQRHLAEIEARARAAAPDPEIEILAADLSIAPEDSSYDPYNKPGPAKPLRVDVEGLKARRRILKKLKRR